MILERITCVHTHSNIPCFMERRYELLESSLFFQLCQLKTRKFKPNPNIFVPLERNDLQN